MKIADRAGLLQNLQQLRWMAIVAKNATVQKNLQKKRGRRQ